MKHFPKIALLLIAYWTDLLMDIGQKDDFISQHSMLFVDGDPNLVSVGHDTLPVAFSGHWLNAKSPAGVLFHTIDIR